MDQHVFIEWCRKHGQWPNDEEAHEKAHYPLPREDGDKWVWLHRDDHQIQGIFQSEEIGRRCFFTPHAREALYQPNYFPLGWFEACDIYEKWAKPYTEACFKGGNTQGVRAVETGQLAEARKKAHQSRRRKIEARQIETGYIFTFDQQSHMAKAFTISNSAISGAIKTGRPVRGFYIKRV